MENNLKLDFTTFIMSMASSAFCSLGLIQNPITQKTEKNLVAAKQQIDLLEMLKEKTKGNLTEDESKLMESALQQLHIAYVDSIEKDRNNGNEKKDEEKEVKKDNKGNN
jgi:hypothetical protein